MGISSSIAWGDAAEACRRSGGREGKRAPELCRNGAGPEQRKRQSVTGSRLREIKFLF
jgi:hypothetical protein